MTGQPAAKPRLRAIDALRGLAILGVVLDHSLRSLHLAEQLPQPFALPLELALRCCAPLFFFAFGIVIELVYVPSPGRPARAERHRRLLRRGLQCWLAYALICMVPVATGEWPLGQGLMAAIGLGASRFGDVLKFYAVALVLATLHIALRERLGRLWLWLGLLLACASLPLADLLPRPASDSAWAHLSGLLIGRPVGVAYFSLWHGWIIVTAGAVVGEAATGWKQHGRIWPVARRSLLVGLGAAACLVGLVMWQGLGPMLERIAAGGIRPAHLPVYYLSGVTAAGLLTTAALALAMRRPDPYRRWPSTILGMGQYSLFVFTATSMLLAAMPDTARTMPIGLRIAAWAGLVVVMALGIWLRIRMGNQQHENRGSEAPASRRDRDAAADGRHQEGATS